MTGAVVADVPFQAPWLPCSAMAVNMHTILPMSARKVRQHQLLSMWNTPALSVLDLASEQIHPHMRVLIGTESVGPQSYHAVEPLVHKPCYYSPSLGGWPCRWWRSRGQCRCSMARRLNQLIVYDFSYVKVDNADPTSVAMDI